VINSLVITTINKVRKEVIEFSKIPNWNLIVVGDKKTPSPWNLKNVIYLSHDKQEKLFPKFSKILPWNIYSRKNIGYLVAIKNKSKVIGETDDDVFPHSNYPPNISKIKKIEIISGAKFINIYKRFTDTHCWPRGYPLEFINSDLKVKKFVKKIFCPIQNSIIDRDSDFDAVYRLVTNKEVKFKKNGEYAIDKGSYCPLNSQNTFFHPEAFLLLYMPSVQPRVEDILRGYIAQRIIWEIGGNVVFSATTAFTSNRNKHDYLKDFKNELPLYLRIPELIKILDSLSLSKNLGKSLIKVYKALRKKGFVDHREVKLVEAWVSEVEKII
jgi:hypothetical protein